MIKLCLLYGGPSSEHDVSCLSAATICRALETTEGVELVLVGIDRRGEWFLQPRTVYDGNRLTIGCNDVLRIHLEPKRGLRVGRNAIDIDVAFPIVHGTFGEDGGLQTILEYCGIPYVGADRMASAVGMHKLLSKMWWADRGLPVVDYCLYVADGSAGSGDIPHELGTFVDRYGYPLFIKPCRGGSSIGVHKIHDQRQLRHALKQASRHDTHILCERAIIGREIEFAVLDTVDNKTLVSEAGEIVTDREFYDYDTKYVDTGHATLIAPAQIESALRSEMQQTAQRAYHIIGCRDLARVDMLLDNDGTYYLNEINTLPGFTQQSMFPILWNISGYPFNTILSVLIERAINRKHADD